jgi:predicted nucleic acid-binding protein
VVLVDTSIWVDHLRKSNTGLVDLLDQAKVVMHPWVIGELACGNMKNRKELMLLFKALPSVEEASDEEVLQLIESKKLMGRGIGWVDVNLLATCLIGGVPIWTGDKNLRTVSAALGVLY